MALKRHIPKKVEIIDRRSKDGGYYIAECDECGIEFYPVSSRAMYCSNRCALRAYRKRNKEEIIIKRTPKKQQRELGVWKHVGDYSKKGLSKYFVQFRSGGLVKELIDEAFYGNNGIGEEYEFEIKGISYKVERLSPNKYDLYEYAYE